MTMIYAVDVGQARDFPAEVILGPGGRRRDGGPLPRWKVHLAQRLKRGMSYDWLASRVAGRVRGAIDQDGRPPLTIIDATGNGRAVVEAVRAKLSDVDATYDGASAVLGATWTAGKTGGGAWPDMTLPKALLVEHTAAALDHGGLVVSETCHGHPDLLREELGAYARRGTRTEAARGHDDLVSALMMAVWLADQVAGWELRNIEF